MATPTSGAVAVARSEPRTRAALLLETIALRHQIAVLERSRTGRPCFRRIDRLLWILLSRWWPQWRESLMIVQAETVLRWRRNGWAAIRRYRSRGRWRGGRPRVSSEVRHLITQMVRENFLWGAPRIHGELRMLGFTVSQATVSRYLPAPSRRPTESWGTFLRNQASAFAQYSEQRSRGYVRLHGQSCWATLIRSAAAQIATICVGLRRGPGRQESALNARRIGLRSAQCERAAMPRVHRLAAVSAGLQKARGNRLPTAVPVRSPPYEARASPGPRSRATQEVTFHVDQVLRSHSRRHRQTVPWVTPSRRARPRTLSPAMLPSTIRALIANPCGMLCARSQRSNSARSAPVTSNRHVRTPMPSRRTNAPLNSET